MQYLRTLDLSETLITNGFLRSAAVKRLTCLCEVNIARTKVSTRGLKHLVSLPSLARLNASHTYARPSVCQHLFSHLQTLRLVNTVARNRDDRLDTDSEEEGAMNATAAPGSAAAAAAAAAAAPAAAPAEGW